MKTATIERVPTKPPCYRLVIWNHEFVKRIRKAYDKDEYISWYSDPKVEEYTEDVATIDNVFEVELVRYDVLRRMAKERGFIFPTHWFVDKTLQRALGPADHDCGYHGGVIVHEWIALDDEREAKYKLSIHPGLTARVGRLELYNHETGEKRFL